MGNGTVIVTEGFKNFCDIMSSYWGVASICAIVWALGDIVVTGLISAVTGNGLKLGGNHMN